MRIKKRKTKSNNNLNTKLYVMENNLKLAIGYLKNDIKSMHNVVMQSNSNTDYVLHGNRRPNNIVIPVPAPEWFKKVIGDYTDLENANTLFGKIAKANAAIDAANAAIGTPANGSSF